LSVVVAAGSLAARIGGNLAFGEFMNYPDDIAKLGLEQYGTYLKR
jgi:hypothetical protein